MTPTQRTLLGVYAALVAIWPIRHLVLTWAFRQLDHLGPRSPRFHSPDPPLVTAIIPAKDEEATLADCLASVRSQSYPNLEILVVDDRSDDRTAAIAREFAGLDPRIRLISIEDLPPGWTGKTHALHVAAGQARGRWFWFLDADTRHEADSLAIVLEYARAHDASMASLLPEMRCESFWERVVQPLAGVILIQNYPLFWANDPGRKLAFANGQYILIDRAAYEAVGGHAAVRDKFVEDIHLARLVKKAGLGSRTAIALGIGSTRMYTSLPQLIRGWSRILYDALDRNPLKLTLQALDPLIFSQTGHIALLAALIMLALGRPAGPFPLYLLALSIAHHLLAYTCLRRLYVLSVPTTRHVAWYPLAGLVLDVILFRAIRMCLTGKVTWRGTSYDEAASPGISTQEPANDAPDSRVLMGYGLHEQPTPVIQSEPTMRPPTSSSEGDRGVDTRRARAAAGAVPWPVCSLLLFVATSAEENALKEEANKLGLIFEKDRGLTKHLRDRGLGDEAWMLGQIGGETVIAVGCSRIKGHPVLGPHGRLGSAAKGVRYLAATGAQGIIQVGTAFGIARGPQKLGDVLVSTSLIPYDQRDVKPSEHAPGYINDYGGIGVEPARSSLVQRCRREMARTNFEFNIHVGAMLSGAARIHCAKFRDELCGTVPHGNDPLVGGEMEGVGLLAAALKADDPAWCVVKGISDFADEARDEDIKTGRVIAPRNAAIFVLSSLLNDDMMPVERGKP